MTGQKRQILEAGGKRHNLLFSYNMLCLVEQQGGTRELLGADVSAKNFTGCRAIIWAAINASRTDTITIEEAGDICEAYAEENGGIEGLARKVNEMLTAANLAGGVPAKNPQPAPDPTTPSPSGRSSKSTGGLRTG
jgi:hypothetical protein